MNDINPHTVRTRIPARLDRLPWSPGIGWLSLGSGRCGSSMVSR
jgi:hypothetical protein